MFIYIIHSTVNDFECSFLQRRANALRQRHIEAIYRRSLSSSTVLEFQSTWLAQP